MTLDATSMPAKPDLFSAIDDGLLGEHGWADTLPTHPAVPLPRHGEHDRHLDQSPKAS